MNLNINLTCPYCGMWLKEDDEKCIRCQKDVRSFIKNIKKKKEENEKNGKTRK